MSDNIRAALYGADYTVRLASRASAAPRRSCGWSASTASRGDVVVREDLLPADVGFGDLVAVPATGAYHFSLASNYNLVTRPAVVAVGDGGRAHPRAPRDHRRPARPRRRAHPRRERSMIRVQARPSASPCSARAPSAPRSPRSCIEHREEFAAADRRPDSSSRASPSATSTRRARGRCRASCSRPTPSRLILGATSSSS